MKNKVFNFLKNRKRFLFVGILLLLLIVVAFFIFGNKKIDNTSIEIVKYSDLKKSVRATGQVISNTNLDLSFNKSGIVKNVNVNVGERVYKGQILATLDQGQVYAALTSAKGALLSAEAKYNKILEGASNEEIALAEVALKNAENDKTLSINNAYKNLLNSTISAYSFSNINSSIAPTISGTYVLEKEGEIKISKYQNGSEVYFSVSGLLNGSGVVSNINLQPIGDSGLFVKFSNISSIEDWIITIPNKKASDYLENLNAYNNTLLSTQAEVDKKQAELNLKKAKARNVDLDIAKADVFSAEGNLQSAQASYEDTIIRAGGDGTITKVDIKYGELSEIGKNVIILEDVENLYIEALINEANIAYLKIGQDVEITFDAFGNEKKFTGVIAHIDPSAQSNDGVVNYKIKISLKEKDDTIRPGMNANVNILAGEKFNVLAIPGAYITKKEGKSFVNIIIDEKNNKIKNKEINTGFVGDNNMTEITFGLNQGDKILLTK